MRAHRWFCPVPSFLLNWRHDLRLQWLTVVSYLAPLVRPKGLQRQYPKHLPQADWFPTSLLRYWN